MVLSSRESVGHTLLGCLLALLALLSSVSATGAISRTLAEPELPYRVTEFPIRVGADGPFDPVISGKWVLWRNAGDQRQISGRNLETGMDFTFDTGASIQTPVDVDGDTVVTVAAFGGPGESVYAYRLPDGQRFTAAEPMADIGPSSPSSRRWPRISGNTVIWTHIRGMTSDIFGYDLAKRRPFSITADPAYQEWPAVSGNYVVWRDNRNSPPMVPGVSGQLIPPEKDIYGFDLSTREEFRITLKTEEVGPPAISGTIVVWSVRREGVNYLYGYDIAKKQDFKITQLPPSIYGGVEVDLDGDLMVWNAQGELDEDVFAYDLKQGKQFTITRAVGTQRAPKVSGNTVVWTDNRRGGVAYGESKPDIYGAKLESGSAAAPPIAGAPEDADGKIEIVWPQGGAPVFEAEKANIGVWLFQSDTLNLAPCQWSPRVQLWKALNNEPAKLVGVGRMEGNRNIVDGSGVPTWEFNDTDVSAALDPKNKLYFFVTLDGVPSRTNIWSHGVDARTYYPWQDAPVGVTSVAETVEAKIQIVWPHKDAPVDQAKKVNVSASLFVPGTLLSPPPDWNPTVRLYRALNNEVGKESAIGQKRLVSTASITCPVWDFNDIDVSAANDPTNKFYFTLGVDGVTTFTNVWAHGADARTHFLQMDKPTQTCRGT